MNSGTSALEAAVHTLDLQPGDEIILPAFTIISCANAIITHGLVPVFVDIKQTDWNVDVQALTNAIHNSNESYNVRTYVRFKLRY